MANLESAVSKTMNFVFADIKPTNNERKKRLSCLRANIGKVANIPLSEITTNENIRHEIDEKSEGFLRLVESVKRYGVLENVVAEIRPNKRGTDYKLVCVAGHRRILAAKRAGNIAKISCLIQHYQKQGDNVGVALAENLNREDLHCLDVAEGYDELVASGWSEKDLASHFCRDVRTIRHYLKMAGWDEDVKALLRSEPQKFSTRVIMRQFAYRKFDKPSELKSAIKNYGKTKPSSDKKTQSKIDTTPGRDKKSLRKDLRIYLSEQNYLSKVIKEEINNAFAALGLI